MSSSTTQEQVSSERKPKPRRAEREIYRPGALRQLKEIANLKVGASADEKKGVPVACSGRNKELDTGGTNLNSSKPNNSQALSQSNKEVSKSGIYSKQSNQTTVLSQSGKASKEKLNTETTKSNLNSLENLSKSKQNEYTLSRRLDTESNFSHKLEYKRSKKTYIDSDKHELKYSAERTKKDFRPSHSKSKSVGTSNKVEVPEKDREKVKLTENPLIGGRNSTFNEKIQSRVKSGHLDEGLRKQEKSRPVDTFASCSLLKILETQDCNKSSLRKNNISLLKNENHSKLVEKSDIPIKIESLKRGSFTYNKKRGGNKNKTSKNSGYQEIPQRIKGLPKYEIFLNQEHMLDTKKTPKTSNKHSSPKSLTGNENNKITSSDFKEGKKSKCDSKLENSVLIGKTVSETPQLSLSEIPQIIENLYLDPSSEDTTSETEDYISGKVQKTINPMMYVNCFKSNSFYESAQDTRNMTQKQCVKNLPHSQNVAWADEKWSPAQRERKKKGKSNKDFGFGESPGRRGIIQLHSSPAHLELSAETISPGQRLLFNPDNPSKPVAVMPSARDLHTSWESSHGGLDKDKVTEESLVGPSLNENSTETEGGSGLDPSIFYNIQKGELDINYFVNSNQLPQEFRRIMDIRMHLQGCYKQLLVSDIRLCQEKNVEGALWKSLYYIIIEKLREYISREPTLKERSQSTLMMIVEEGLVYLQSLLTDIQKAYRFSLEAHFEDDLTMLPGTKNRVRQALYSCQKILLSLGDLARYKEQYNPNPNYSHAKKWYEMALQVNPKNGRPFNQLAIIAVSQKRSLDVVYYYIRSLTASNPFNSARDSLISMFDDIRRKYESMNITAQGSGSDFKIQSTQSEDQQFCRRDGGSSLRQEIWIRPDSGATNKRTLSQSDPEEEKRSRIEEMLRVPQDQLMKQFLTSYLHCHGMLFSRVGLDHFNAVLGETLNLFQALVQLSPPKLSPTHLLQIMAINMFAVDNTQLRDARLERGYRSAAQDLAIFLSQEMFSRLAEVMVKLFPTSLHYTPRDPTAGTNVPSSKDEGSAPPAASSPGPMGAESQRLFQSPLTHFIPAAKVWCDWLLYQSSVWNPPPIYHDISGVDTWGVIGELATIVKGIGPPDAILTEDGTSLPYLSPVILPEDAFLRGYAPIVSAQMGVLYTPRNQHKERAQDWARVKKLQLCLSQFLCGVEPPVLRLQKTDQGEILVAVVTVSPPNSPAISRSSIGSCEVDLEDSISEAEGSNSDDEGDLVASTVEVGGEDTPLASTVRLLARRKKILEKRQKQQRKMQAILEGAVTLEMEVKPRYLVPDTNCFIEKLSIVRSLIDNTNYTFMVPLIVLAELDGLSRDAAVEKYGDAAHAVNVREGAATALLFIQSNKNSRLKCVTSQGSVAPANMFSLEMDTLKDITNDDKILSCCLHLCSDTNKRRPIKEGVRRLHREVVLLTEDRNLRVKAYARDVPVRELSDFAHWAGVK